MRSTGLRRGILAFKHARSAAHCQTHVICCAQSSSCAFRGIVLTSDLQSAVRLCRLSTERLKLGTT